MNHLSFPVGLLMLISLTARSAAGGEVLEGLGENAGWRAAAPGVRHRITTEHLPKPFATESARNQPRVVKQPEGARVRVPEGFEATVFTRDVKNPRYLMVAPNGDIFVSESGPGRVRVLRDADGDGRPELNEVYASGLKQPFGLALYPPGPEPGYLYVAETDGVVRFPYRTGDTRAEGKPERITELSSGGRLEGGGHWTRDIAFSNDGTRLFASVGSKSNVSDEPVENGRARIFVMSPDGSNKRVFATGLRNAVGIAVHPESGDLWASVNERDGLGDDLVPDYITRVAEGGFYGWPWFYLGRNLDPRHKDNPHPELAGKVIVPDVLVTAHAASLNMVFYTGDQFPEEYRNDAFAAFHGSWNRRPRTGYSVVRVPLENGKPQGVYEDFLTGFVLENENVWGRPVGLAVAKDGSLLMSEDGNDTLWRIRYVK